MGNKHAVKWCVECRRPTVKESRPECKHCGCPDWSAEQPDPSDRHLMEKRLARNGREMRLLPRSVVELRRQQQQHRRAQQQQRPVSPPFPFAAHPASDLARAVDITPREAAEQAARREREARLQREREAIDIGALCMGVSRARRKLDLARTKLLQAKRRSRTNQEIERGKVKCGGGERAYI